MAQVHVPVDDGVGTDAAEVLGRVACAGVASVLSPRFDVSLSDEATVRAQRQVPPLLSVSTPPAPVQVVASTGEPLSTGHPQTESRPDKALQVLESPANLEGVLRSEAYGWPRLVFPPLKKSGHIIIDACTREGSCLPTALSVC